MLINGDLTVDLFDIETASIASSSSVSSHSTKNSSKDKRSRAKRTSKVDKDKIVPHTRRTSSKLTDASTGVESPLYASHPRSVRKSKRVTEEKAEPLDSIQMSSKTPTRSKDKSVKPQKNLIEEVMYGES